MNTLEVTYADKAGRLIEGSPDKVKIEQLEQALGELDSKSAKVYQCETVEQLTSEQRSEIINGEYCFIQVQESLYLITVREEDNLHFIHYDSEEQVLYTYWYDVDNLNVSSIHLYALQGSITKHSNVGDVLTIDDHNNPVWVAPDAPGTKLYRHAVSLTGGGASYLLIFITTSNDLITKESTGSDIYFKLKGDTLINFYGNRSANALTGILFPISGAPGTSCYTLYTLNTTTGTFELFNLSSWTITDTVTSL